MINIFPGTHVSVIVCICLQAVPLREWLVVRLCRTMRMNGRALKMSVCLSEASFAHLAMTGLLKGMGVSGGRLFLRLFFFGGSKKNGHIQGCLGTVPVFCSHRKKIYTPTYTASLQNYKRVIGTHPYKEKKYIFFFSFFIFFLLIYKR